MGGIKEIINWLNCDVEDAVDWDSSWRGNLNRSLTFFQKEDEGKRDDVEDESDFRVKISNNYTFGCFLKGYSWLEQLEQCDYSEMIFLKKNSWQSCTAEWTTYARWSFEIFAPK